MPGAADPLYVAARRVLLDALQAVEEHLGGVVVVGAQAIYIHTGTGDLAVTPYTTDGDLALDPSLLRASPLIEDLMHAASFDLHPYDVGAWRKQVLVDGAEHLLVVDFLVPAAVGGPGRRAARIPPHDKRTARKVSGLEGTLVDKDIMRIGSLDPEDTRKFAVAVAGPSGLLVAKVFKLGDRADSANRLSDKDALDVFRLLQAVPTDELARRIAALRNSQQSREATESGLIQFGELFGRPSGIGCMMAARAAAPLESHQRITAAAAALARDLLAAV